MGEIWSSDVAISFRSIFAPFNPFLHPKTLRNPFPWLQCISDTGTFIREYQLSESRARSSPVTNYRHFALGQSCVSRTLPTAWPYMHVKRCELIICPFINEYACILQNGSGLELDASAPASPILYTGTGTYPYFEMLSPCMRWGGSLCS